MDQKEFNEIQATFPWTERVIPTLRGGGLVQVIDCNGNEVPIFKMTKFLAAITASLAAKAAQEKEQAA